LKICAKPRAARWLRNIAKEHKSYQQNSRHAIKRPGYQERYSVVHRNRRRGKTGRFTGGKASPAAVFRQLNLLLLICPKVELRGTVAYPLSAGDR